MKRDRCTCVVGTTLLDCAVHVAPSESECAYVVHVERDGKDGAHSYIYEGLTFFHHAAELFVASQVAAILPYIGVWRAGELMVYM